jgi:hypothetical protein
MKNITTWRPDTCECVIHYSWDSEVPEEQRVHTPVEEVLATTGEIIKRKVCAAHSGVIESEGKHLEHHDKVLEENQRKNLVIEHIKETLGQEPEWSFDSSRNLKIKLKDVVKKDKDDLKDSVRNKFQKVIIE